MSEESVFAFGRKGMGAALSQRGEEIVERKMTGQNEVLAKLQSQGLDVSVLTHRRIHGEAIGPDQEEVQANLPLCHTEGLRSVSDIEGEEISGSLSTEDLIAHYKTKIKRLEGELQHLNHVVKSQANKLLLLREALERRQDETLEARQLKQD